MSVLLGSRVTRRQALALAAAAGAGVALHRPPSARGADLSVVPPEANTLHLVGDVHFGALPYARRDVVTADLLSGDVPPVPHLQLGDQTESATAAQDDAFWAWWNQVGGWRRCVLGNHDLFSGRGYRAWERKYGQARNGVADFGAERWRIVYIGPDQLQSDNTSIVIADRTLKWLDQQLATLPPPVLIACHAPLYDTVVGPTSGPDGQFSSLEQPFHARPEAAITDILSRRSAAKAWLSAHTHSDVSAPGLIKTHRVGSRDIVTVNASALYYTGRTRESTDPLRSLYLSIYPDRFEVRMRDHDLRTWGEINGQQVTVVPMPA